MDIEYRAYRHHQDYIGQRELFALSFPETRGTVSESNAHHEWKFSGFPADIPSYQYVGCVGDTLVGYYAALPFHYVIDGEVCRAGMVCDVMTHPAYRGRGIFTNIGRYAIAAMQADGLKFTTGYPVRAAVIPGHLKVGWKIVQEMPVYARPIGLRSVLPGPMRRLAPLASFLLQAAQAWTRLWPTRYVARSLAREAFFSTFAANLEYEAFLSAWTGEQSNALIKDAAFLHWRTGAPGTKYYFVTLHFEGNLVGLAIALPTCLKGIETLAILDFMVLREHLEGCRALHAELMRLAQAARKDLIACMSSRRWAKLYRFAGSCYIRTSTKFSLIVRNLGQEIPDESVYTGSRWHVFWIDSDDI